MKLREFIKIHKIGIILTTPIGKITKEGKTELVMLGGEGIKYLSDVKVMIQFVEESNTDSKSAYKRIFFVDRNHQFAFNIEYGGKLIPIKWHTPKINPAKAGGFRTMNKTKELKGQLKIGDFSWLIVNAKFLKLD